MKQEQQAYKKFKSDLEELDKKYKKDTEELDKLKEKYLKSADMAELSEKKLKHSKLALDDPMNLDFNKDRFAEMQVTIFKSEI